MNKKKLEDLLWGAAEFLRGQIDASDYKQYIFPLLFYKRLSDVYLEKYNEALEIHDGDPEYAAMPMFHRFNIPLGSGTQHRQKYCGCHPKRLAFD